MNWLFSCLSELLAFMSFRLTIRVASRHTGTNGLRQSENMASGLNSMQRTLRRSSGVRLCELGLPRNRPLNRQGDGGAHGSSFPLDGCAAAYGPNTGVQATAVTLRSTAAPDAPH